MERPRACTTASPERDLVTRNRDRYRALEPALVPCDDLGSPGDVDVPEDLRRRVGGAGAE